LNTLSTTVTTLENNTQRVVGSITMSPSTTAPPYTLICNGSAVSTTTYPLLFAKIGYAYGGSGASFNLPDFRSYFPLGGNGTTSGVASSNLATGNGYIGANNTQQIYGGAYIGQSGIPSFPIMTLAPPHAHGINDPQHAHFVGDIGSVGYSNLSTDFLASGIIGSPAYTDNAVTGITVNNSGTGIQQIDPISGISGVNYTMPFVAMNFFITYA
jgi:hypothetical protein